MRARTVFRADADRRRFFLHLDVLLLHFNLQSDVEFLRLPGGDLHSASWSTAKPFAVTVTL